MPEILPLRIPVQKNVLTLEEGKRRTANWRDLAKHVYKDEKAKMPHGVFIPFTDILELSKICNEITEYTKPPSTVAERIYIVGVRGYYCLKEKALVPIPISAGVFPIELVLVPVYQTNYREPGSPGENEYDPAYETYDLVVPVPSAKDADESGDAGDYSIYDITQPCPKLCDTESGLF